ncbi:hypothetical protein [Aurantiacibacter suaedae]|uniref:hypothetical protein n=1 Tax=Aurantiacibacter suaedae TaxID=2545755 RepID=UPI0010F7E6AA|nr:hypothetical protein [Aurantiacibacter suaedae]
MLVVMGSTSSLFSSSRSAMIALPFVGRRRDDKGWTHRGKLTLVLAGAAFSWALVIAGICLIL